MAYIDAMVMPGHCSAAGVALISSTVATVPKKVDELFSQFTPHSAGIEENAVGRCEMRSGSQPLLSAIVKQVKFIIASKVGRQYPRTPSE